MSRFLPRAESSIIPVPSRADAVAVTREQTPPYPARTAAEAADLYRHHRRDLLVSAAAPSSTLCVTLRIHPNVLTLVGVIINVGGRLGARPRPLRAGRRRDDRREHLRLHRRQGRPPAAPASRSSARSGTRRSIGSPTWRCSTGLIFLYSKLGRSDYVLIAALTLIFSIMTSYARARAESLIEQVQGRLHGAARTHRALHDRRVHQPHGGGAVGDPGAVGARRRQPHLLHLPRAEQPADADARRRCAACSIARSSGPTSARRFPTISGSSRSSRSCGSRRPTGSAIRLRRARVCSPGSACFLADSPSARHPSDNTSMSPNGVCAHLRAITAVKHPKRRVCEECERSAQIGFTSVSARNAARRSAATIHLTSTPPNTRERPGTR